MYVLIRRLKEDTTQMYHLIRTLTRDHFIRSLTHDLTETHHLIMITRKWITADEDDS
jgi:hypothetical protein